ncbi:hypothetical protein Aduo_001190 [Ancylostoma duodenale]
MDRIYGATELGCPYRTEPALYEMEEGESVYNLDGQDVTLSEEQRKAVDLGTSTLPIVGIQAAFGTGKTVVGAIIAARRAHAGKRVVMMASTNAAVAQFTQTLLSLTAYRHLNVLRFVSDAAAQENLTPTPVDMNQILMSLGDEFDAELIEEEKALCRKFKAGRSVLERYIENPDLALDMSEEDKEEYAIAERNVSTTAKKMMALMYRLRFPDIGCITTASLLNTLGTPGGALTDDDSTDDDTEELQESQGRYQLLIGDKASQIPEPALAAVSNRMPLAQQVYIGDVHQPEPHARCHRDSPAATYGARGVMSVICAARAVPIAPLVRTYRAHPALNELPNRFAYNGELVSGIHPEDRRMLLDVMRFPTPKVPFMFVDVDGSSKRAHNMSQYNDTELEVCCNLVRLLTASAIAPANICVIAFYKEQYRRAEQQLAEMGHVPSLIKVPLWNRVIDWATSLSAVVPHKEISRYFPDV